MPEKYVENFVRVKKQRENKKAIEKQISNRFIELYRIGSKNGKHRKRSAYVL
jgi:hypothetical protein